MNPRIQHAVDVGITRYGKSSLAEALYIPKMGKGEAQVWLDPPGTMAKTAACHAAKTGLFANGRAIYDPMAEMAAVPGYAFFSPSADGDADTREAGNNLRKSETKAMLLRAEGKLDATKNQKINEGLEDALDLLIFQRAPVPFYYLRDCFRARTPEHDYLMANCTNFDVVRKFLWYAEMANRDWEYNCGPAERRIRTVCKIVQFRRRCMPTFDLALFLNAGGTLILGGENDGTLSRQDLGFLMGMVLLLILQLARGGLLTNTVTIILDEGLATGLIDGNVARALREAAKWGVRFHLILQDPVALEPEVSQAIFQCCDILIFHRQINPPARRFAAEIIATPQIDPLKVKYVERTERQLDDGYEQIATRSKSKSDGGRSTETKGMTLRGLKRTVIDEKTHHYTFEEQVKLYEQMLAGLGVGEFLRREGSYVSKEPEYMPLLPLPSSKKDGEPLWFDKRNRITLAERNLQTAFAAVRNPPVYRTQADLPVPTSPPPPTQADDDIE